MPQLDLLSFLSQFFWFFISFWSLYVVSFRYFLVPTAMSLKIREYLSLSAGAQNEVTVNTLSPNGSKEFDTLVTSYNALITKSSENQLSNSKKHINTLVNEARTTIDKKTKKAALNYVLKKACVDFTKR